MSETTELVAIIRNADGSERQQYPLHGHLTGYGVMLFDSEGRWALPSSGGSVEIREQDSQ